MLGHWVDFARSAVALPADAAGQKLRASVPDLIQLQAVWFALQHMAELPACERTLGLDRAGVLIDQHAGALLQRFAGNTMPEGAAELIAEARNALAAARGLS